MLVLHFDFNNNQAFVLELPDGQKINIKLYRKNGGRKISFDAPKDIKIYRNRQEK